MEYWSIGVLEKIQYSLLLSNILNIFSEVGYASTKLVELRGGPDSAGTVACPTFKKPERSDTIILGILVILQL